MNMKTITVDIVSEKAIGLNAAQEQALKRLLRPILNPGVDGQDPLAAILAVTAAKARDAGISDEDVDAELEAYNRERRL